jgi:hypothetical protein
MPAALGTLGFVHDVSLGHRGALRVVVSSQLLRFRGTNTLLMTSTRVLRLVRDLETSKPRPPRQPSGGAYDDLTLWEQIDAGAQYTPAKKWLTSVPILLSVQLSNGLAHERG